MVNEFIEWFEELVDEIQESIKNVVIVIVMCIFLLIISPLWIPALIFWYFFVREKKKRHKDIPDSWKDKITSRFERVE